jgi:iron-sulfur cluster repair protein YtfE (RIC family)
MADHLDAIDILKEDHRRISGLFELVRRTGALNEKLTLFQEIKEELELHIFIEEKIFFPALSKFDKMTRSLDQAYEEVDEISDILDEVDQMELESVDGTPPKSLIEFDEAVEELNTMFAEHLENTAIDLFPAISKYLDAEDLTALANEINAIRSLGLAA